MNIYIQSLINIIQEKNRVLTTQKRLGYIADGITQVHKLYLHRGFKITHMHTDCDFEPIRK